MVFRLNIVATSFYMVIGLSSSGAFASEDKSRPLHLIPLQPLDMISTGSIAIHPAGSTHIQPGETTSCTIHRSAEHHFVHCRGKKRTELTLTESMTLQQLAVETDA
ncbi:hypothetical protein, partial [Sansalvadorimonas verongulae]|uniref:hypothetical protein n=1 Tax=Sansalvadorimonas verongulae TaxID=2172824 RepID=UPI001E609A3F